ncbi:predicted protein [Naegleria gruberi]|uniref:Predicted protein n=1 Tax=Naegleria gruberi TaxID=5762 RepID=D2VWQ9_NAEGR|nr:uncharacterized protein NAEGRDRAFT_52865 [Naegleria gruberi]EFC38662.1 predicted protein [Naegleria gruberi]|eukprot:XP_002671406.1 predicted protein [Naegleria gruberi strain NEG-M]
MSFLFGSKKKENLFDKLNQNNNTVNNVYGETTGLLSAQYSSSTSGGSPPSNNQEKANTIFSELSSFKPPEGEHNLNPIRSDFAIMKKQSFKKEEDYFTKQNEEKKPVQISLQEKVHGLFIDLSYALGIYGVPSHRLEMHLKTLFDCFPLEKCEFRYTPSSLWFCFTPNFNLNRNDEYEEGDGIVTHNSNAYLSKSKFYVVKLDEYDLEDMDLVKLCELDQLASEIPELMAVTENNPESLSNLIDDLRGRIRTIISRYSFVRSAIRLFIANLISASMWVMYYDGSWMEMLCGLIVGIATGILVVIAEKYPSFNRVNPFISAIVAGTVASLTKVIFSKMLTEEDRGKYPFSVFLVTLCALFGLLPHVSFTNGISELATKNLVSGSMRVFYAFVLILQVCFNSFAQF